MSSTINKHTIMLSNKTRPIIYTEFQAKVLSGKINVCNEVSLEMNRIDKLISNPNIYYDPKPLYGFKKFVEAELTLTDGEDVKLLDTFLLWAEQLLCWFYYEQITVYDKNAKNGVGGYVTKKVKKRLINKQFLIVPRSNAKTLYQSYIQQYELVVNPRTTAQIAVAPTMKQAEEVLSPLRTAIARRKGPLFKFLTEGNKFSNTLMKKTKLESTKKGIEYRVTNSVLEIKPLSIDKLQGLRTAVATFDEWLSGETRENPLIAIEQGAAKVPDYIILAVSSEGTIRNGVGDDIKMELLDILKGSYDDPHTSIWYYKLNSIEDVNNPKVWDMANPNIDITVTYETIQRDVSKAEAQPAYRNEILAKRFNIAGEGTTYMFAYQDTLINKRKVYKGLPCALGGDLSKGDDFCSFTFLFPNIAGGFGIDSIHFITEHALNKVPIALRHKYTTFIEDGSLVIRPGVTLDLEGDVLDLLIDYIRTKDYIVVCFGYDPYGATDFIAHWTKVFGSYGIVKVPQGTKTESIPCGEMKNLAEAKIIYFHQPLFSFCMGNAILEIDSNGNQKLSKQRRDKKIDAVSAWLCAHVAYKAYKNHF